MSAKRKWQSLSKKVWRLVEVHIFFVMSILAGNAVVKHLSTSVSKAQDKRQRVAIERAVPDYLFLETATIEKGTLRKKPIPLETEWLFLIPPVGRTWLCQEQQLAAFGEPPRLAFNLFQTRAPLRT